MKISFDYPPNIKEIKKAFKISDRTVFTYGDTLHNPGRGKIPHDLLVHEITHMEQQGDNPAGWWRKYIKDTEFRLNQEVEAYRNQYRQYIKIVKDRNKRAVFIYRIATDLSSDLYGKIINYSEAVRLIKESNNHEK